MQHQTITGRILYTSRKPGREGAERGRESFIMTRHPDRRVTFRAHCEIEEPDPEVLRDVIYSMDAQGRPADCHILLSVGGKFMGSGWIRLSPERIECESFSDSIGRISQTVSVTGPYDGFGTHPVVCDGYFTRCMDLSKGPHKRRIRFFLPSVDHRGATPPLIAEAHLMLEYVGEERVSVPAGEFDCRHFRFSDEHGGMVSDKGAHPEYNVWVTADDDSIFVKARVGGYMMTHYELVELSR